MFLKKQITQTNIFLLLFYVICLAHSMFYCQAYSTVKRACRPVGHQPPPIIFQPEGGVQQKKTQRVKVSQNYCLIVKVFTCLVILDKFELRFGREPGKRLVTGVMRASLRPWHWLWLAQPLLEVAGHFPHTQEVQQLRAQATWHLSIWNMMMWTLNLRS